MTDAESLRLMKESFEHTIVRFVPGMLELFFAGGFSREDFSSFFVSITNNGGS